MRKQTKFLYPIYVQWSKYNHNIIWQTKKTKNPWQIQDREKDSYIVTVAFITEESWIMIHWVNQNFINQLTQLKKNLIFKWKKPTNPPKPISPYPFPLFLLSLCKNKFFFLKKRQLKRNPFSPNPLEIHSRRHRIKLNSKQENKIQQEIDQDNII